MKKIIIDLDDTISFTKDGDYKNALPNEAVINKLRECKNNGYSITIYTSRNMRTFEGNIGKINIHTLPIILDWLRDNQVPYDEVLVGKPWCGFEGFYVDDRAIRPSEFINWSLEEINQKLNIK